MLRGELGNVHDRFQHRLEASVDSVPFTPIENTLKMNELSNISGVDTSTMTRMIDQLVEKGLVIRQPGENDRRQVHIGLTAEGLRLHRELAGALDKFYQDSLDRIPEKNRAVIIKPGESK
jgi:DNA-binding MarR family transcriptional regulator